ncbi:hypothetical protein GTV32_08435 [Gordonia sp. SID5947]|uniref:hypothetical protein n=1 Tax=Gordonia sp. SID5947 TaxID=2690315 RepID=UPI00136A230C|nr:hypothetical protein [Gordonia sp. SID5947]MYR06342.1 hypothetical protein [Gordonia sp. SID5947]
MARLFMVDRRDRVIRSKLSRAAGLEYGLADDDTLCPGGDRRLTPGAKAWEYDAATPR